MDCPGCQNTFSEGVLDPYILIACGHSVCMQCVKAASPEEQESIKIRCPACEQMTEVSSLEMVPKNIALLSMVRSSLSVKSHKDGDEHVSAQSPKMSTRTHAEQLEQRLSNSYCSQSQKGVNRENYSSMLNFTPRKDFLENLNLEEQINLAEVQTPEPSEETNLTTIELKPASRPEHLCKDHGKPIEGYCMNDKVLMCIECILSGEHKNHEICAIAKAAQKEKEALTLKFKLSKSLQENGESASQKVQAHKENLKL